MKGTVPHKQEIVKIELTLSDSNETVISTVRDLGACPMRKRLVSEWIKSTSKLSI